MKIEIENIVKVQIEHEHPIGKTDTFCRTCGLPVTTDDIKKSFVCSACRHFVNEGDSFCSNCGQDLTGGIKKTEHYFTGPVETSHFELIKNKIKEAKDTKKNVD
jgi:hypothetical protein